MKYLLAVVLLASSLSFAGMNTGGYFEISQIWTWPSETDSVVLIQLTDTHTLCPGGYWFKGTSGGINLSLSVALSAYHSKSKVLIYADETDDWPGLGGIECRIQAIVLE